MVLYLNRITVYLCAAECCSALTITTHSQTFSNFEIMKSKFNWASDPLLLGLGFRATGLGPCAPPTNQISCSPLLTVGLFILIFATLNFVNINSILWLLLKNN